LSGTTPANSRRTHVTNEARAKPNPNKMISRFRTLGLIAALAIAPVAHAVPILGGNITLTEDSLVTVTFEGYSAGYTSNLSLDMPTNGLGTLFTNKTASVGSTLTLGTFAAGTELIFRLFVHDTGLTFFTGEASRNPDNVAHATVNAVGNTHFVGFEDLFGGGDRDYNDFKFSVATKAVPDGAATVGLLGLGLGVLALARRRLN